MWSRCTLPTLWLPANKPTTPCSSKKDELVHYPDAPAPRPASLFASVSSAKASSSPPGLALSKPATTPSNMTGSIDIVLLEEAPPAVGESWRQLGQGSPRLHELRTILAW